jgi:hypothetical protein
MGLNCVLLQNFPIIIPLLLLYMMHRNLHGNIIHMTTRTLIHSLFCILDLILLASRPNFADGARTT